jgi:sugar phosphate isomerase/epimerase
MLGLSLVMLEAKPLEDNLRLFEELQDQFPLEACEIHSEGSLYESACHLGDHKEFSLISHLRKNIRKLGLHLPFMDLNPISQDGLVIESTERIFHEWMKYASDMDADYAVLHLRGGLPVSSKKNYQNNQEVWLPFIEKLAEQAQAYKFDLCIENADDVRNFETISELAEKCTNQVKLCMDIGHLYERIYPRAPLLRKILRLNDIFSPVPFAWDRNLPVGKSGDWQKMVESHKNKLGCVHVHNHDGRNSHKTLYEGKIDLMPLGNLSVLLKDIPVIIESDYRLKEKDTIIKDLKFLEELMKYES